MKLCKPLYLGAVALAASLGAHAQSSVTLYGVLDAHLDQVTAGAQRGGGSVIKLNDGHTWGLNGSRWGIRGTEDLGGGLKAGVLMEAGLGVDDGTQKQGRAFGRQIYVSLAQAGVGEVRLGRQYAFHDELLIQNNPMYGSTVMYPGGAGLTNTTSPLLPMFIDAARIDNMVQLMSASFSGFSAQAAIAPGEGTGMRYQGVKGAYTAPGKAFAGLAYEWNTDGATGNKVNKLLSASANVNLGAVQLFGGLQSVKSLNTGAGALTSITNWGITGPRNFTATQLQASTVGVAVPVGANLTLGSNFIRTKYSGTAASATLGRLSVAAKLDLSKLTAVYAGVSFASGDLKEYIGEKRILQLGLRKSF